MFPNVYSVTSPVANQGDGKGVGHVLYHAVPVSASRPRAARQQVNALQILSRGEWGIWPRGRNRVSVAAEGQRRAQLLMLLGFGIGRRYEDRRSP